MVRRAKRKTTKRKVVRKKTARKKSPAKRRSKVKKAMKTVSNKAAYWAAYRDLQKRVDKAWQKLQWNVKRKASSQMIVRSKNDLLLLLGECNYMARECMRISNKNSRKK